MKVVNQEKVKNYILRLIQNHRKDYVSSTIEAFGISKSSVYNYIKKMESDGLIEKQGNTYNIRTNTYHYLFKNDGTLGEDRIFNQFISPYIQFKKNVFGNGNFKTKKELQNSFFLFSMLFENKKKSVLQHSFYYLLKFKSWFFWFCVTIKVSRHIDFSSKWSYSDFHFHRNCFFTFC